MAKSVHPNVIPLWPNVLVRLNEAAEKTPGGLYLPDNAKEHPKRGEVLRLPLNMPDGEDIPFDVGDVVYFQRYSGTEVEKEDKTLLFLKIEDALGVQEK